MRAGFAIEADRLVLEAIAATSTNPPRASRLLGYVSVGMLGAAVLPHPAVEVAVASTAARILDGLLPAGAGRLTGSVAATRGRLAAQGVTPAQLAVTEQRAALIAGLLLRRAATDGANETPPFQPPTPFPGSWVPTPPADVYPPLEPNAPNWQTWHLSSSSQFRPPPPLRPGDAGYDAQIREVYTVSQNLTEEQKRIAYFWADGAGTVTPPGHWNQIAIDLIEASGLGLRGTTLVLATLNTAQADAFIACWDAKYAYYTERPVTAIRRTIDPNWLPLLTTPPFPSYVSGHSTTSAAAATVLSAFFPSRRAQLQTWAEEAAISRLYGGIHFRMDNEEGLTPGSARGSGCARPRDRAGAARPAERAWLANPGRRARSGSQPKHATNAQKIMQR